MEIEFFKEKQLGLEIPYQDYSENHYLKKLKLACNLDDVVDSNLSDLQNFKNIQTWVLSNWKNSTMTENAEILHILQNAKQGNYGFIDNNVIISACLQSLGYKVRKIWLSSPDVEEPNQTTIHIIYEVYIKDINKWIFLDPKFDIMVSKDGIPMNAVEFQQALINQDELEVSNPVEKISSEEYLEWISQYLFCFTISLNKGAISVWDRVFGVKKKLTLVPVGEELPNYFKRVKRLSTNLVTNSLQDFYPHSIQN